MAPLLAHGLPVKLPSDLYQHLRQAIEKGDSKCKQLAHEKGVQRVLGHLMPNRRNVALEVLAHPLGLVTEAERVTDHPAKQGSEATWSSLSRAGDGAGPSVCVHRGPILQGFSGFLGKSARRRVTDRSTQISEGKGPCLASSLLSPVNPDCIPHAVSIPLKIQDIVHGEITRSQKFRSTLEYLSFPHKSPCSQTKASPGHVSKPAC